MLRSRRGSAGSAYSVGAGVTIAIATIIVLALASSASAGNMWIRKWGDSLFWFNPHTREWQPYTANDADSAVAGNVAGSAFWEAYLSQLSGTDTRPTLWYVGANDAFDSLAAVREFQAGLSSVDVTETTARWALAPYRDTSIYRISEAGGSFSGQAVVGAYAWSTWNEAARGAATVDTTLYYDLAFDPASFSYRTGGASQAGMSFSSWNTDPVAAGKSLESFGYPQLLYFGMNPGDPSAPGVNSTSLAGWTTQSDIGATTNAFNMEIVSDPSLVNDFTIAGEGLLARIPVVTNSATGVSYDASGQPIPNPIQFAGAGYVPPLISLNLQKFSGFTTATGVDGAISAGDGVAPVGVGTSAGVLPPGSFPLGGSLPGAVMSGGQIYFAPVSGGIAVPVLTAPTQPSSPSSTLASTSQSQSPPAGGNPRVSITPSAVRVPIGTEVRIAWSADGVTAYTVTSTSAGTVRQHAHTASTSGSVLSARNGNFGYTKSTPGIVVFEITPQ